MQSQMSLQIAGGRKAFLADIALVRLLPRVHQMMLLEVGKLGETLGTNVTLEGPLTGVGSKVNFQIGKLPKGFETDVTLVVHLPILLLEWIWK